MILQNSYSIKFLELTIALLVMLPVLVSAQETDTTRQSRELDEREQALELKYKINRPASGGLLTESGVHEVPEPTVYYTPPFKGQEYLDKAVEAYRKELKERMGPDWLYKFFRIVKPFVNNQFEFGVYQINDLPVVDRENELFQSKNSDEKLE